MDRIDAANAALATFSNSTIERRHGGWYVCWENSRGQTTSRRWQRQAGGDFYAVWSNQWPGGGTAMTALSQLIRWIRGQPVLPLGVWRYWATDKIRLLPATAVDALAHAGYPAHADCVLCGRRIDDRMDWWSLDGVSGPCCGHTTGCRQRPNDNPNPGD